MRIFQVLVAMYLYEMDTIMKQFEKGKENKIHAYLAFYKYNCIVKAIFPYLPKECRPEIIKYLVTKWSPRFDLESRYVPINRNGSEWKLLPQDRPINAPSMMNIHEQLYFDLRRSFSIKLNWSHLDNDALIHMYVLAALGTVEDIQKYREVIQKFVFRYMFLAISMKYANFSVVQYFLKNTEFFQMDIVVARTNIVQQAAEYGYIEIVRNFVEQHDIDPSKNDNYCLRKASTNGHLHVIKYLSEELDVKKYTIDPAALCHSSFYYAVERGHLDVIKYFIGLDGAYPNEESAWSSQYSLLSRAAYYGHLHVIKYLIGLDMPFYRISPVAQECQAFISAAGRGHLDVVKYFMEELDQTKSDQKINPAAQDNRAFFYACKNDHLPVVKYLMTLISKHGIDPAIDHSAPIRYAAYRGHLNVVKYLMSLDSKYGINPAALDNHALCLAARSGRIHVIKYLVEEVDPKFQINPADQDNLALIEASGFGHINVVQYIMGLDSSKYGTNPAAQNNNAILKAVKRNRYPVVKFLMALDPNYGIDQAIGTKYLQRIDLSKYVDWSVDYSSDSSDSDALFSYSSTDYSSDDSSSLGSSPFFSSYDPSDESSLDDESYDSDFSL